MKRLFVLCAVITLICGFSSAEMKNLVIYGSDSQQLGAHNQVTALSFSNGKMTVHSVEAADAEYELADVTNMTIGNGSTTGSVDILDCATEVNLNGGILSISAQKQIDKICIYTVEGKLVAAASPASEQFSLKINNSAALLIVRIDYTNGTQILKLTNR